jgi:aromatic ring-cleaving dioxygenase
MPHAVAARREESPMIEKTPQSVANLGYHAHIYYDPGSTRAAAERVCAEIGEKFPVEIDGFRDTPVGPHPIANVLVIFRAEQFEHVVPYLMLNRGGLDILVHPLTEDAVEDHSSYAVWLGNPVPLKLHTLPRGRGGRLPSGVSA